VLFRSERAEVRLRRDGREITAGGRFAERARETYAEGTATYGATPFDGGLLRDIMVAPKAGPAGPVVFLIQGYTCDSMETEAGASHHELMQGLLKRGVSTFRIEKPQAGDSRGGPACADIDFATEVRAFQAGYRTLRERYGVTPDRIFILGHSLGGLEAPLVAAAGPAPRGVAVYGTVVRSWRDYLLDVLKYQGFAAAGADPAQGEAAGEAVRPLIEKIYAGGQSPAAVAAADPASVERLKTWLGWDGGERLMGRHAAFWRQISAMPLLAAWRDTKSQVLAVYGESDFAAVNAEDHKLIAEVANHYRPGTGRFVFVPRTGHGMRLDGDRAAARARKPTDPRPAFNGDLVTIFGDWIDATMAQPAVEASGRKG